jgi:carbonic anhydrase
MNSIQTSEQALTRLMNGNQRFVTGNLTHPNQSPDQRSVLVESQNPFAAILSCADSRVPSNIIFDQGLGDLFVVRVAGNIVDNTVLGSLEFAVIKLQVPLIMVLGHANCGAVQATLKGDKLPGHLPNIARAIQPAVESISNQPGDPLENAIRANAKMVADQLCNSKPILFSQVASGQVEIVPAYYDLASGKVEILQ